MSTKNNHMIRKLKYIYILIAILTSKKNTKRCDQTQNFSLSIKLFDKNHIIYNKKATNTQNIFNLMEKKILARLQVGQRGEEKNIVNNCKVRSRKNNILKNCVYIQRKFQVVKKMICTKRSLGETQIHFIYFLTLLLGKR